MKLSIILPTYNEKDNICILIKQIESVLAKLPLDYEILVVDDNSPDGTASEVKKTFKKDKRVNCLVRYKDRGLAPSFKDGIKNTKGDIILIMDTDLSHPPSTIPRLFKELKYNDAVIASRYIKGGGMEAPWHKYYGSLIMNRVISLILGLKVRDSTGGFTMFKRNALKGIDLNRVFKGYGDFHFRLLYEFKKRYKKYKEIPFKYALRQHGQTKSKLINMGFGYLFEALKARFGH